MSRVIRLDGDPPLVPVREDDEAKLGEANPYHDRRGRFTSKSAPVAGLSYASSPGIALEVLVDGEQATILPEDVGRFMELAAERSDHPDLTELKVEGTLKFGGDGLGIARKDMPQLPEGAQREAFFAELRARGISVKAERINPQLLHPVQKEISASVAGKLYMADRHGKLREDNRLTVSSDNYVIDGHHRWAAKTATSFEKPRTTVGIDRVDMPVHQLLSEAESYTKAAGIAGKALGDNVVTEAIRLDGGLPLIEANPHHDELGRFAPKTVVRAGLDPGADFVTADGTRFTEDEVRAIRDWQSNFYDVDYVQSNPTSQMARDFMSAVDKAPVVEGKVYRGIREKVDRPLSGMGTYKGDATGPEMFDSWKGRIGKTIAMKEPVSTSPSLNTAGRFGTTVFEIDHKGTAHDIRYLSSFPSFPEAVMKPGTFKVTGVHIGRPTDYKGGRFSPFHTNPQSPNLIVSVERVGDAA